MLNASSGRSWATEVVYPKFVLTGGYDAGFAVELMRKDVRLGARLIEEAGVSIPVVSRPPGSGTPARATSQTTRT